MIRVKKDDLLKKWIPLVVIASAVVIIIGLIFKSSFPQIVSSIIVSIILILSGFIFRSVGRDRNREEEKEFDRDNKNI